MVSVKKFVGTVIVMAVILGVVVAKGLTSQGLHIPQCYIIRSLETWTERVKSEDGLFTQKHVHMHSVTLEKVGLAFNIRQSTPEWPEGLFCFYAKRDSG